MYERSDVVGDEWVGVGGWEEADVTDGGVTEDFFSLDEVCDASVLGWIIGGCVAGGTAWTGWCGCPAFDAWLTFHADDRVSCWSRR